MPRRPPRLRAPRGVPRDPPIPLGPCTTSQGEDVSSRDTEGTGSLDDTEILPRVPSQASLTPGTSSSPGSSPTVLLVPGDHGHPHDSPSDTWASPHATVSLRALEGGSEWQNPLSLGTHQPNWPQGSFSHLQAPQPPGSTAVEPGSPAVPFSPAAHSTRCPQEHLEDEQQGQLPFEQHSPGTEATSSPEDARLQAGWACSVPARPLSDEGLRRRLRALGHEPGPVTELTRRLYQRRLQELERGSRPRRAGHSPELVTALRTGCIPDCAQDELALAQQFDRPDPSRCWREGLAKSSFIYLLLDPRTTQNLPLRSHRLSPAKCFRTFVKSIFYVGKGTCGRPYCHLTQALSQHRAGTQRGCPKVRRILEIWVSGHGVVLVQCFQSSLAAEAYTRESCLVEALGLQTITNQRQGQCYGVAARWAAERRRRLGVHMLHRAMCIFLTEGERQLRPADIQGGR
ncbi:ankyrin repeat and LEM domain-containing protein 1 isoform X2 [Colius striatus]|uniref:ankyrin repeat and LEM domain-containing protein 1 isoform X2 n=1 Tax=Colius striatus TaxID=57412 RepID=UPI002B1E6ADE|nr:ankyrin repeat and LEM domain-containing protein 1 isoform X2 [Colius striatus]